MASRLFVSILEGESPDTTRPLLMTGDWEVVRAVAEVLGRRLQGGHQEPVDVLQLLDDGDEGARPTR